MSTTVRRFSAQEKQPVTLAMNSASGLPVILGKGSGRKGKRKYKRGREKKRKGLTEQQKHFKAFCSQIAGFNYQRLDEVWSDPRLDDSESSSSEEEEDDDDDEEEKATEAVPVPEPERSKPTATPFRGISLAPVQEEKEAPLPTPVTYLHHHHHIHTQDTRALDDNMRHLVSGLTPPVPNPIQHSVKSDSVKSRFGRIHDESVGVWHTISPSANTWAATNLPSSSVPAAPAAGSNLFGSYSAASPAVAHPLDAPNDSIGPSQAGMPGRPSTAAAAPVSNDLWPAMSVLNSTGMTGPMSGIARDHITSLNIARPMLKPAAYTALSLALRNLRNCKDYITRNLTWDELVNGAEYRDYFCHYVALIISSNDVVSGKKWERKENYFAVINGMNRVYHWFNTQSAIQRKRFENDMRR